MSVENGDSNQPLPEGFDSWNAYWATQGMHWRTEPEIDEARQAYLAERRVVRPDIERGIYPFRDEHGGIKLTRADVEWLLATHESGGMCGPVDWQDPKQRERAGLDLRGAQLQGENLSHLPLARILGGMPYNHAAQEHRENAAVHLEQANMQHVFLQGASLRRAHMETTDLSFAHLEQASLVWGHLEGANLSQAYLAGANIRAAYFSDVNYLNGIILADKRHSGVRLAGVRWGGADLTVVDWSQLAQLGDDDDVWSPILLHGRQAKRRERLRRIERSVRANRQLATALRARGLNEDADRFAYRAQQMRRLVLRQHHQYLRYSGSLLLDLLAGYGYRPGRSILVYLAVILWFANFYVWASHGFFSLGLSPTHVQPLAWYEGLILSVSSFHGRGFQPFQNLNDPIAALAGMQAVFGLIIEVSFIATFTQRFFAR